MSNNMKKKLKLIGISIKSKGIKYYWCDICNCYINVGSGKESKLQILLKLFKDDGITDPLLLVKKSNSYKWPFTYSIYTELIRGGMGEVLAKSICEILKVSIL